MTPTHRLKAWILTILILSNWAGACWCCLKVTHQLKLLHQMDEQETAIARQLEQEWGIESQVEVDPDGNSFLSGVYNPSVLFSHTTEKDTFYFQLSTKEANLGLETVIDYPNGNPRENNPQSVLLGSFFKDFLFPSEILPQKPAPYSVQPPASSTPYLAGPQAEVPTPPPDGSFPGRFPIRPASSLES